MKYRSLVSAVLVALLSAACANPVRTGSGPDYSKSPDSLLIRIDIRGGLLGPRDAYSTMPSASLFGDGTLVGLGAQIEIYPPPALPPVVTTVLTEDGVAAVMKRAEAAGLTSGNKEYRNDRVMDAPTTRITVNAGGKTHVTAAYALGIEPGSSETKDIAAFVSDLNGIAGGASEESLPDWMPGNSIESEASTEIKLDRLQIVALTGSAVGVPDDSYQAQEVQWPLDSSIESLGRPVEGSPEVMCFVLEKEQARKVLDALSGTNQLTMWKSAERTYQLAPRPLMPDEQPCEV